MAYGGAGVWKSVGFGKSGSFRASLSELFTAIAKEAMSNYSSFVLIRDSFSQVSLVVSYLFLTLICGVPSFVLHFHVPFFIMFNI